MQDTTNMLLLPRSEVVLHLVVLPAGLRHKKICLAVERSWKEEEGVSCWLEGGFTDASFSQDNL